MLKKLELKDSDYKNFINIQKIKIKFLCSCFDKNHLLLCGFTKMILLKFHQANKQFSTFKVCNLKKSHIILCMSTIDEITLAINTIIKSGTPKKYIFIAL